MSTKFTLSLLLIFIYWPSLIIADTSDEIFFKEYTYRASEDDSKNSSRKKAIQQIKILLSEEVGTHIESYLQIDKTIKNGVSFEDVKQEINNLSVGITKLKVLDEDWDGKNYYIRASVAINTETTMTLLLEAIKSKSSEKDIKRLNKILAEQKAAIKSSDEKIKQMNRKLIGQEISNEARKNELMKLKKKQIQSNKKQQAYNRQISEEQRELNAIKKRIASTKNRISKQSRKACQLIKNMTMPEVISIIGEPDSHNRAYRDTSYVWYYGNVKVHFNSKIVVSLSNCS